MIPVDSLPKIESALIAEHHVEGRRYIYPLQDGSIFLLCFHLNWRYKKCEPYSYFHINPITGTITQLPAPIKGNIWLLPTKDDYFLVGVSWETYEGRPEGIQCAL